MSNTKDLKFFQDNHWVELTRFNSRGQEIATVTIVPDNVENLYNSQFKDATPYGEIFTYEKWKG